LKVNMLTLCTAVKFVSLPKIRFYSVFCWKGLEGINVFIIGKNNQSEILKMQVGT